MHTIKCKTCGKEADNVLMRESVLNFTRCSLQKGDIDGEHVSTEGAEILGYNCGVCGAAFEEDDCAKIDEIING